MDTTNNKNRTEKREPINEIKKLTGDLKVWKKWEIS